MAQKVEPECVIGMLNSHLELKMFLVGFGISIADIVLLFYIAPHFVNYKNFLWVLFNSKDLKISKSLSFLTFSDGLIICSIYLGFKNWCIVLTVLFHFQMRISSRLLKLSWKKWQKNKIDWNKRKRRRSKVLNNQRRKVKRRIRRKS